MRLSACRRGDTGRAGSVLVACRASGTESGDRISPWALLSTAMKVRDVTETLDLARATAGMDQMVVKHRPRLPSDNGLR